MKMNWGIWLGIIGCGIGLAVGIGSAIASGEILSAVIICIVALVMVSVFSFFLKPIFKNAKLLKTGVQRMGKILSFSDTGVTINNSPQVKFTLEVLDEYNRPYEVTTKTVISRLAVGGFYAGMPVIVRVDPNDKMQVAIESFGEILQNSTDAARPGQHLAPQQELEASYEKILTQNQQINDNILYNGIAAKARIVSATDLGPRVNGNNPFMHFYVEVQTGPQESFYAEVKGEIAETSIHKYQPGKLVNVKYLEKDKTRAVFDGN